MDFAADVGQGCRHQLHAAEPIFQPVVATYASEANKTFSVWRSVPDGLLDFRPHPKVNPVRAVFTHQRLSERRFFTEFAALDEPAVEDPRMPGEGT